ncbi:hypothetical protein [Streptomyces sp. NPDC101132]|uniref:hypothetical protein n=1 Tax=Streptomyces sp. NPDC101132 TaxID=3366110 RepID=UPI0037F5DF1B
MPEATRLPDADTRVLLLALAARLSAERPTEPMRRSVLDALALTFAVRRHGQTHRADVAEASLLKHAPDVPDGASRGQYARLLRLAAGGEG